MHQLQSQLAPLSQSPENGVKDAVFSANVGDCRVCHYRCPGYQESRCGFVWRHGTWHHHRDWWWHYSGPSTRSTDFLDCRFQLHLGSPVCRPAGFFPDQEVSTALSPVALSRWVGSGTVRIVRHRKSAGTAPGRTSGGDDGRADQYWRRHSA
ncbi:hypothetical protein D3C85_1052610 [compost metagenome]